MARTYAFVSASTSDTERDRESAFVMTLTFTDALIDDLPLTEAVTVAVPSFLAVITPLLSTDTTEESELFHT